MLVEIALTIPFTSSAHRNPLPPPPAPPDYVWRRDHDLSSIAVSPESQLFGRTISRRPQLRKTATHEGMYPRCPSERASCMA